VLFSQSVKKAVAGEILIKLIVFVKEKLLFRGKKNTI
jgi:hypothetical protein